MEDMYKVLNTSLLRIKMLDFTFMGRKEQNCCGIQEDSAVF